MHSGGSPVAVLRATARVGCVATRLPTRECLGARLGVQELLASDLTACLQGFTMASPSDGVRKCLTQHRNAYLISMPV